MTSPTAAQELESPTALAGSRDSADGLAQRKIRVLILDDDGIMRDGLCALMEGDSRLEIIGAVNSARNLMRLAANVQPHVLVLDFSVTLNTGPETIPHVKRRWPSARVLVLTFRRDDQIIEAALRAGADGYVLKTDNRAELFTAIHSIATGKGYISTSVLDRVVSGYTRSPDRTQNREDSAGALTKREQEVIALIAKGYRTREMAQLLSLSHKTVEKHRTNLMRKLGLRSATAVVAYAITHGYVGL